RVRRRGAWLDKQILVSEGGDRRLGGGTALAADGRRDRGERASRFGSAGRAVGAADPCLAPVGRADRRQRRALDVVLLLDLGLAVPVGGLRHAGLRRLEVLRPGRPRPAL